MYNCTDTQRSSYDVLHENVYTNGKQMHTLATLVPRLTWARKGQSGCVSAISCIFTTYTPYCNIRKQNGGPHYMVTITCCRLYSGEQREDRTGTKWREEESRGRAFRSIVILYKDGKCTLSMVAFFELKNDKKSHSRNKTDFLVCVSVWERDYTLAVYLTHLCNLIINVEPWALQLAILVPHSFALWQNMVSVIYNSANQQSMAHTEV